MTGFSRIFKGFLFLLLGGVLIGAATLPLSAQVTIPESATITSAVFTIVTYGLPSNQIVSLHRITKDWSELGVTWNSFMPGPGDPPSFDPAAFSSFSTAINGPHAIDVTALVQAWVNGTFPNYGILLEQGLTPYTLYPSSEFGAEPALRPKLDITYLTADAVPVQVTVAIQRPDVAQDGVADADIWPFRPDDNFGSATPLHTGNLNGYEKMTLVRFFFDVIPDHPSPGTGTPGYWMNHPEAWPVDSIVIGGVAYTKDQAIALMFAPTAGDVTYTMFQALVAAELNVMIGNASSCIASTISAAQDWMTIHPVGSGVAARGSTSPWRVGEPLYIMLDNYNNGLLCAPHRD